MSLRMVIGWLGVLLAAGCAGTVTEETGTDGGMGDPSSPNNPRGAGDSISSPRGASNPGNADKLPSVGIGLSGSSSAGASSGTDNSANANGGRGWTSGPSTGGGAEYGGAGGGPSAKGGAGGAAGGPAGKGGAGGGASVTVTVGGPVPPYTLATFVSIPGSTAAIEGNGWIDEQVMATQQVAIPIPESATVAAVVVDANGNWIDSQVSACDAAPANAGNLTVPGDYSTIQAALDHAAPGSTVLVSAGVYHEHLRLRSFVKLMGAGARDTILDGEGTGENLIDFTDATSAVVTGFTLRNVGQAVTCANIGPTACSGNWYSAAVYADGTHDGCGSESSLLFARNIVMGNDIGFLLYFQARAIITNNIFMTNNYAFVANHHQDHSLLAQNVFFHNGDAIIAQASFLNVVGNLLVGNRTHISQESIQEGFIGCNVITIDDPGFMAPGALDFRLRPDSEAKGHGCIGDQHVAPTDPGAFGGPLGNWSL
jgi:hypothetical protein